MTTGKKAPKSYYEYKIDWVYITPELRNQYLAVPLGQRSYIEIGKSINYTGEFLRQIFAWKPTDKYPVQRINKPVWEAIVKYVDGKKTHAVPSEAIAGDLGGSKSVAPSNGKTKKTGIIEQAAPTVNEMVTPRCRGEKTYLGVQAAKSKSTQKQKDEKGKIPVNTDYRTSLRNKKLGLK